MVTVGMNYQVLPGKDAEFVAVFDRVVELMNRMDGHNDSRLYRDVHDEHSYLIVSEWSDEQAFRDFIASDSFRNVTDWGKAKVLAGRPRHEVYRSAATA